MTTKSQSSKKKRTERREKKTQKKRQDLTTALYWEALSNCDEIIFHFPNDLWVHIFSYLATATMIRLRFTCRFFHFLLTNARHEHVSTLVPISLQLWSSTKKKHKKRASPYTRVISEDQLHTYQSLLFRHVDFANPDYFAQVWRSREFYIADWNYARRLGCTSSSYIEEPYERWMNPYSFGDKRVHTDDQFARTAHVRITEEALINIICEFAPFIQTLHLHDCDAVTDNVVAIISERCTALKSLILKGCCRITEQALSHVISSPIMQQNLENFDMTECVGVSFVTVNTVEPLRPFVKLSHLNLDPRGEFDVVAQFLEQLSDELYSDYAAQNKEKHYDEVKLRSNALLYTEPFNPTKLSHFCHTLKELNISTYLLLGSGIHILTFMFPHLESVTITDGSQDFPLGETLTASVSSSMIAAAKNNTTLKELRTSGYLSADLSLSDFVQFYPGLRIFENHDLSPDELATFIDLHTELEVLSCFGTNIEFFERVRLPSQLNVLVLDMSKPEYESAHAEHCKLFFSQYGKQLKVLALKFEGYNLNLSTDFGNMISRMIMQYCPNLEELHLVDMKLRATKAQELFLWDFPIVFPQLRVLLLSNVILENTKALDDADFQSLPEMNSNLESVHIGGTTGFWLRLLCNRVNKLRHLCVDKRITVSETLLSGLVTAENAHRIRTLSCLSPTSLINHLAELVSDKQCIDLEGIAFEMEHETDIASAISVVKKAGQNLVNLMCEAFAINGTHDDLFLTVVDHCPNVRFFIIYLSISSFAISKLVESPRKNLRTVMIRERGSFKEQLATFKWTTIY